MNPLASLLNFAGPDLIVVLLIVLVLFGAKKLPDLARGMGQALKEFQKAKDDFGHELRSNGTALGPNQSKDPAAEFAETAYPREGPVR